MSGTDADRGAEGVPPSGAAEPSALPLTRGPAEGLLPTRIVRAPNETASPPDETRTGVGRRETGEGPHAAPPRQFGRYLLRDEIARGGMGVVYRAEDVDLHRIVALKMILGGNLADPDDRRRFRAEAEAAASLEHPHLVPVYDVGEHEGQAYFTMKLFEGNLKDRIPDLLEDPRAVARLMTTVARAVHFAHQHGILHRDLKPANILMDGLGEPHVSDFGLARRVDSGAGLTQSGTVVGTPGYMSPEQAAGATRQLTTATDVYALGAILYTLLTGVIPFDDDDFVQVLIAVREDDPIPPREIRPGADRDLETICLKAMAKDPEGRYASAEALAEELTRWLDGEPIHARPAGAPERAWKWVRRRPLVASLSAVATLSITLGALGILWQWRHAKEERDRAVVAQAEAERNATAARQARAEADSRRDELRQALYVTDVQFARVAWERGELARLDKLLARQVPAPTDRDLRGFEWHYLARLAAGERLRIPDHTPSALCFSPDGRRLAASASGGRIRLLDPATGVETGSVSLPPLQEGEEPAGVAFSPDGTSLQVLLWRAQPGKDGAPDPTALLGALRPSLEPLARTLRASTLPLDGGPASPWAAIDPASIPTPIGGSATQPSIVYLGAPGHIFLCMGFAVSPDRSLLAACGMAQPFDLERLRRMDVDALKELVEKTREALLLWPLGGGEPRVVATERGGMSRWVAFSPDGTRIATASALHSFLDLWEAPSGVHVRRIQTPGIASSLVWGANPVRIAATHVDGRCTLWDPATGVQVADLLGHRGRAAAAAISPDGRTIATGGDDGVLRLWDPERPPGALTLSGHTEMVTDLVFDETGETLVSLDVDGVVRRWDASTGRPLGALSIKTGSLPLVATCLDRHGSRATWRESRESVAVWSVAEGKRAHGIAGTGGDGMTIGFSPDGRTIAIAEHEFSFTRGSVRFLDAQSGAALGTLEGLDAVVLSLRYSRDGARIATVSFRLGGKMLADVWDAGTGKRVEAFPSSIEAQPWTPAFSPDGRRIAFAVQTSTGSLLRILDIDTGRELLQVSDLPYQTMRLEWSPDGRRLAAVAMVASRGNGGVRLLDAETGQEILALDPEGAPYSVIAFSPDGRRLAAATHSTQASNFPVPVRRGGEVKVRIWNADPR